MLSQAHVSPGNTMLQFVMRRHVLSDAIFRPEINAFNFYDILQYEYEEHYSTS